MIFKTIFLILLKLFKKTVFPIVFLFAFPLIASASGSLSHKDEDGKKKSKKEEKSYWHNLPYFMDDITLIAGLNYGGIYMSNHYREMSYASGFQIGVESYVPVARIVFVNYGLHYAQRNFQYQGRLTQNSFLDFPVFASFELPELRSVDLRFLLGGQVSYRLSSKTENPFAQEPSSTGVFPSKPDEYKHFDLGWTFGISGEYRSVYFRLRSYVGLNNIDPRDQGSLNSFHLDVGYFLFRGLRK
jgi:hypothetical protein